ncbi:MAG: aldehyde dehydrogenase family protein [Actinomycetota bacterium]|nr:aldehyde dehydrogenase family protein [Actinomycetota bacterium]
MGRVSRLVARRAGPVGVALTAWDLWRRIPPKQRRRIMRQARKHGPTVAKKIVQARRNRRSNS